MFDEKELRRDVCVDYTMSHAINGSSISDGKMEIPGVGKVDKFNFLVTGNLKGAILFNGLYGKTTETKVVCKSTDGKHGVLMVAPADIPAGYNINPDGNCTKCVMGTVQRYKKGGYNDKIPACPLYTFVSGYVLNDKGVVHFITLRLTGIGAKPFFKAQRGMTISDELLVSVEDKEFNFVIAEKNELEPHNTLPDRFQETINAELDKRIELQKFRESIAPDFTKEFSQDNLGSDNPNLPAIGYDEPEF